MRNLAFLALILTAACTVHKEGDDIKVQPITDRIGDWDANLGPANGSSLRGTAAVRAEGATSTVTVSIAGSTGGAQHPWHVHRGSCGNDQGIVGGASAYPVMTVASDGTATATAHPTVGLDENQSYFVNVHRSPGDMTPVACGNLKH